MPRDQARASFVKRNIHKYELCFVYSIMSIHPKNPCGVYCISSPHRGICAAPSTHCTCFATGRVNPVREHNSMKSKEALLGDYREMVEHNALHKDVVFLEVLIDIRDVLAAVEKRLRTMNDQPDRRGV